MIDPLPAPLGASRRALRRASRCASIVCAAIALLGTGCQAPTFALESRRELVTVADGWLAMGTFFDADLRVPPRREEEARAWLDALPAELPRLEAIYSRHDPRSELSRLNEALASPTVLAESLRISPELEAILFEALEVWEATAGAFDPTIGPLIDVWTDAAEEGAFPDLESLRRVRRRVGAQTLLLPGDGVLEVTVRGARLDLDGLSKGVALDRLGDDFRSRFPGAAALFSFGESSVLAIGDPEGRMRGGGWRLEVHSRDAEAARLSTIALRDAALSVSSSVGRTSEIAGKRISHVVDPRTGVAVAGTVEAVVVSERAGLADGWSTALLVLGAQREALRLLDRAGLEAYVFESAGRIAATEGWEALEVRARAPGSVDAGPGIVPLDRPR